MNLIYYNYNLATQLKFKKKKCSIMSYLIKTTVTYFKSDQDAKLVGTFWFL